MSSGKTRWIPVKSLIMRNMLMKPISSETVITPIDLVNGNNFPESLRKCVSLHDFGESGKGLGLMAEKEYNEGDIIFIEAPVIGLNQTSAKAITNSFEALSKPLQNLVLSLYANGCHYSRLYLPYLNRGVSKAFDPKTGPKIPREIDVFLTNRFSTEDYDHSLFLLLSRINHSCDPCAKRVDVLLPNQSPASALIAGRKIPKGCEIDISYISDQKLLLPYDDRQENLKERFSRCLCKRCSQEDGSGLIIDNTRLLKCRSCSIGTRVGFAEGSLFGKCSNENCNRQIKFKNRPELNGVIATLGAKCNGQSSSETEKYEVTIKRSSIESKTSLSKVANERYKLMKVKRSSFDFINDMEASGAIDERLQHPEKFGLKKEDLVVKDDTLYRLEKEKVDEYRELERNVATNPTDPDYYEEFLKSALQILGENHWVIERFHDMILDLCAQLTNDRYCQRMGARRQPKGYNRAIEHAKKNIDIWNQHAGRLCQKRAWKHEKIGDLCSANRKFAKSIEHYQSALKELSLIYSTGSHHVTTVEGKLQKAIEGVEDVQDVHDQEASPCITQ